MNNRSIQQHLKSCRTVLCGNDSRIFAFHICISLLRCLMLGVMVAVYNFGKHHVVQKYNKYCCSCYYLSFSHNDGFDLSNCMPECTDCNYCKSYFDNNAQNAYNHINSSTHCPITPEYHDPTSWFQWNFDKTGCSNKIKLSSLFFWRRKYINMGWWTIGVMCLYIVLLTGLFISKRWIKNAMTLSKILILLNFFGLTIYFYLFFVPVHFYHKTYKNVGDNNIAVKCEVDAAGDIVHVLITGFVLGVLVILFIIQILFIIYKVLEIKFKNTNNYQPQAKEASNSGLSLPLSSSNSGINHSQEDEKKSTSDNQHVQHKSTEYIFFEPNVKWISKIIKWCKNIPFTYYGRIFYAGLHLVLFIALFIFLIIGIALTIRNGGKYHGFVTYQVYLIIFVNICLLTILFDFSRGVKLVFCS